MVQLQFPLQHPAALRGSLQLQGPPVGLHVHVPFSHSPCPKFVRVHGVPFVAVPQWPPAHVWQVGQLLGVQVQFPPMQT